MIDPAAPAITTASPLLHHSPGHDPFPAKEAVPATDFISAEHKFTEVCVFARPLAELVAPPPLRHHVETFATIIADLMLADLRTFHHALARQFDGISLR